MTAQRAIQRATPQLLAFAAQHALQHHHLARDIGDQLLGGDMQLGIQQLQATHFLFTHIKPLAGQKQATQYHHQGCIEPKDSPQRMRAIDVRGGRVHGVTSRNVSCLSVTE